MARNINNSRLNFVAIWRRYIQCGETKIDCDPPFLFLWETIGIGTGQRFDQRALAMINMACCGNDEMTRRHFVHAARAALITLSSC